MNTVPEKGRSFLVIDPFTYFLHGHSLQFRRVVQLRLLVFHLVCVAEFLFFGHLLSLLPQFLYFVEQHFYLRQQKYLARCLGQLRIFCDAETSALLAQFGRLYFELSKSVVAQVLQFCLGVQRHALGNHQVFHLPKGQGVVERLFVCRSELELVAIFVIFFELSDSFILFSLEVFMYFFNVFVVQKNIIVRVDHALRGFDRLQGLLHRAVCVVKAIVGIMGLKLQ